MDSNSRPTWILLRGLAREAAHWGGFAEALRLAMPDSRVIALDLPGNGQLHSVSSPPSISAMVSYCRAEMERRGEKPPFYLLAMSLGAMVATEWSYQAPGDVAGCVLINTSFRPFSPFYRRLRPHNYWPLVRLAVTRAAPVEWEHTILRLTSNRAKELEGVIPEWTAIRRLRPVSTRNTLRQLLAAARYRVRSKAPATKLLILASERDCLVDVKCSLTVASRWACSLELHSSAGHDLPLDDPLWVIEQVKRWITDTPALDSGSTSQLKATAMPSAMLPMPVAENVLDQSRACYRDL